MSSGQVDVLVRRSVKGVMTASSIIDARGENDLSGMATALISDAMSPAGPSARGAGRDSGAGRGG